MGVSAFDYLAEHPQLGALGRQHMTTMTAMTAPAIIAAYDFTPFRTICDIGGGQGLLLKAILEANPHLTGILYDQASVVQNHVLADLSDRVEIVAGDFFEHVTQADLMMMKWVLHDWADDKCAIILGHCRQVMQRGSRLLIVDQVINEPVDRMTAFADLNMQVISSGRERTAAEFSALLQSAGLQLQRIIPTASPMPIVEAALAEAATPN